MFDQEALHMPAALLIGFEKQGQAARSKVIVDGEHRGQLFTPAVLPGEKKLPAIREESPWPEPEPKKAGQCHYGSCPPPARLPPGSGAVPGLRRPVGKPKWPRVHFAA